MNPLKNSGQEECEHEFIKKEVLIDEVPNKPQVYNYGEIMVCKKCWEVKNNL